MKPQPGDALIVIDVQPDFMPGGALVVPEGDQIVKPIAELLPQFETVVFTQDWHPRGHISFASSHKDRKEYEIILLYGKEQRLWPDHCVQGTAGAKIHEGLNVDAATLILRKGANPGIDSYSAFEENYGPNEQRSPTGLLGFLFDRVVRRIVLVGLAGDYCVYWSAQSCGMAIPTVVIWDLVKFVEPDKRKDYELLYRKASVVPI